MRWHFNILLTFLVSGLWHGANWTFVVWGGLNGSYLLFSLWTQPLRHELTKRLGLARYPRIHGFFKIIITFFLICVSWVFFRANSLRDAFYILYKSVHSFVSPFQYLNLTHPATIGLTQLQLVIALASLLFLIVVEAAQEYNHFRFIFAKWPIGLRWATYYALSLSIIFLGVFKHSPFIYFQF